MDMYQYGSQKLAGMTIKAYTRLVRHRFRELESHIDPRVEITNPRYISIGREVSIRPYSWIYAITNTNEKKNVYSPSIRIEDGCNIGRFCHITCTNEVVIEKHVLIAEGVLIADNIHGYSDVDLPIILQDQISLGPVVIGSGSWLGNGARIVGKVRIGRNCVIGTNAFVNKDVPDYCVIAGIPGRIVKRFDVDLGRWLTTDEPLTSESMIRNVM
jgi:acetyltransferase-like isoleucine patch superfamily enzyme